MTWKNTEMRALNCAIASLRRHRSLQMRPLHNSQVRDEDLPLQPAVPQSSIMLAILALVLTVESHDVILFQDIGQQSGQGDRLLKGIAKERQKGYQNMSGKKTTFGKFLVRQGYL